MNLLAQKIIQLKGTLAGGASPREIVEVEERLQAVLPKELKEFLLLHNGTMEDTDEGVWRFWPCAEITSSQAYRGQEERVIDYSELSLLGVEGSEVKLPASRLILFADAMVDAATYGVFVSPGHPWDGMIFDDANGYVSARNMEEWIRAFVEQAESGLIISGADENDTILRG